MSDKKTIVLDTIFYVDGVNKYDMSDNGKRKKSVNYDLIDSSKLKVKDRWATPIDCVNISIVNTIDAGLEIGKKYKITLEQID